MMRSIIVAALAGLSSASSLNLELHHHESDFQAGTLDGHLQALAARHADQAPLGGHSNGDVDVPLSPVGSGYYTDISLGTPPQSFKMFVATSTGDMWVPSAHCRSLGCWLHSTYDSSESSSFEANGTHYSFKLGHKAALKGFLSHDSLVLGPLTIPDQSFAEITHEAGLMWLGTKFDGVLGLAYPGKCSTGTPPFLNAIDQGLLDKPQFGLYLGHRGEPVAGYLSFGGPNHNLYKGDFSYLPVSSDKRFWDTALTSVALGSSDVELKSYIAAFDSAAALLYFPTALAEILNQEIGAEKAHHGLYKFKCSKHDELPTLKLNFDGNEFELGPEDYLLKHGHVCYSLIYPLDIPSDKGSIAVLGTPFLRKYYTLYDAGNASIGVAKAVHPPK